MVITKHFAIHGKNYRSKLIKYILNPNKTKKLSYLLSNLVVKNYQILVLLTVKDFA